MGKTIDRLLPIAAAVATTAAGFPEFAPVAAGATQGGVNYSQTHNIGSALKSGALTGAGSFVGGNIGSSLFPASSGNVMDVLEGGLGSDLGSAAGNAIGSSAFTGLGGIAGSTLGASLGNSFAPQGPMKNAGHYPYVPAQQSLGQMPDSVANLGGVTNSIGAGKSINSMSSLTPQQQASGLATQGLYGGGLGPQEQKYYGSLINNQLVDGGRNVKPLSSLSPIEQSYNEKLGFGGAQNSNSLLEMLSKWNPASQSA